MRTKTLLIFLLFSFSARIFAQGTWIQKASNQFTQGNAVSVAFSIGSLGFVGTGAVGGTVITTNSLWQYDPANNSWSVKTSLPNSPRDRAMGFSIGNKGYIGTGLQNGVPLNDFWEYDQPSDSWTQRADFLGGACYEATGFSSSTKGFVINGNQLWEYDPASNTWARKSDYPGTPRSKATAFVINNKAYYGMGIQSFPHQDELWEYDISNDSWHQKASIPTTTSTIGDFPVSFAIGNFGYVGTGTSMAGTVSFWQYDTANDTWLQMPDLPAFPRFGASGFSIGNKGYLGQGSVYLSPANDLYEFSPDSNFTSIYSIISENKIEVSPNPFTCQTKIHISSLNNFDGTIFIYNILGKEVRSTNIIHTNEITIERDNLNSGIYFYEIRDFKNDIIGKGKLVMEAN